MREVPYIRWRWSEFLSGRISRRPAVEQALFHLLVAMICQKGGPVTLLRVDYIDLSERMHVAVEQVSSALESLADREIIDIDKDGSVGIKFLAEEFGRISTVADTKRSAAQKRWENKPAQAMHTDACAMHMHTGALQTDACGMHSSQKEKEKEKERTDITLEQPPTSAGQPPQNPHCCVLYTNGAILTESPTFSRFWLAYPKKVGKAGAAEAWNAAMSAGIDPEEIICGILGEPTLQAEEAKFLPQPAAWLADSRWLGGMTIAERDRMRAAKEEAAKPRVRTPMVLPEGWTKPGRKEVVS